KAVKRSLAFDRLHEVRIAQVGILRERRLRQALRISQKSTAMARAQGTRPKQTEINVPVLSPRTFSESRHALATGPNAPEPKPAACGWNETSIATLSVSLASTLRRVASLSNSGFTWVNP